MELPIHIPSHIRSWCRDSQSASHSYIFYFEKDALLVDDETHFVNACVSRETDTLIFCVSHKTDVLNFRISHDIDVVNSHVPQETK